MNFRPLLAFPQIKDGKWHILAFDHTAWGQMGVGLEVSREFAIRFHFAQDCICELKLGISLVFWATDREQYQGGLG